MLTAANLMAGPRGRRLVLEYVQAAEAQGRSAGSPLAEPTLTSLVHTLGYGPGAQLLVHPAPLPQQKTVRYSTVATGLDHLPWRSQPPGPEFLPRASKPPRLPLVTVAEVCAHVRSLTPAPVTTADLLSPLDWTVSSAEYYGEPDVTDRLLSQPELIEALWPFAQALAAAPATAWFDSSCVETRQEMLLFDDPTYRPNAADLPARLRRAGQALIDDEARLRREAGRVRGSWHGFPPKRARRHGWLWSTNVYASVPVSTRRVPDFGPVAGSFQEDGTGEDSVYVAGLTVGAGARVFDIHTSEDWRWLCANYPLEVTHHSGELRRLNTGREGRWLMPHWARVARDYQAVRLSLAGFLAVSGVCVPIDGEFAGLLAGWSPEATYWLAADFSYAGPAVRWRREDLPGGPWRWRAEGTPAAGSDARPPRAR